MKMQLTTTLQVNLNLKKNENKIIENLIENISIDIMNSLQTF